MPADKPTISAILLNYNHASFLPQALDGALNQTAPFDELLVIDDGSTDNSVAIIEERIRGIPHARLIRNPKNMGVMPTANKAIGEARGDFVFFLSADDEYSRRIVEWSRALLERHPGIAIASGNAYIHHVNSGKTTLSALPYPQRAAFYPAADLAAIAKKRALTFLGGPSLIRRKTLLESGGYPPQLRWHADWFVCLLISLRHGFGYIPEPLTTFSIFDRQYSHGRHDWKQQRPVIEALLRLLMQEHPDAYDFFRRNAVLPTYDPQTLALLLRNKEFRHYLTPLLVWRLLTYKLLARAATVLPADRRAMLRKWLRV